MTESPFSTQGWNRYSYVGNSPLNFTDPSGYCFMSCFWKPIFKAIGNFLRQNWGSLVQLAAVALICQGNPICAGVVTGIIVGVIGGDLGLALRSGFIARTPRELERPNSVVVFSPRFAIEVRGRRRLGKCR